jgi:hypothetical protein
MGIIISKEETYKIKTNNKDIILDITEGNGEILTSVITIKGKLKKPIDDEGHIFKLGKKADLQNKNVFINSTATDVSPNTNDLIVNFDIKEGGNLTSFEQAKGTVDSQGNSITFIKSINFT